MDGSPGMEANEAKGELRCGGVCPVCPSPGTRLSWEQRFSGSRGQPGGGRALTSPELASTARQGTLTVSRPAGARPLEAQPCREGGPLSPATHWSPWELDRVGRGSRLPEGIQPHLPRHLPGFTSMASCS